MNASGGSVYHPSANGRALIGHVEQRPHSVLHERAPDRLVVGMRERPTVDERGRDHRELHAVAFQARQLGEQPRLIAQRDVRDRVHSSPTVRRDRRAPPIPRGHVRSERTEIRVERALPQEPEVGEHDCFVEAHLDQAIGARRGVPVVAR